jgi:hypothetical protein
MTEKELLELATKDFPGLTIGRYIDDALHGRELGRHGDLLAGFIVATISGCFDPGASDEEQLETALGALTQAETDLGQVLAVLEHELNRRQTCPPLP